MKDKANLYGLWEKEDIVNDLQKAYGESAVLVSTKSILENKNKWASTICFELFNRKRETLITEAYHFSYIKFAIDEQGKIWGFVGGKSQFHWKNPSDIVFYDIEDVKWVNKKAAVFMRKNKFRWDKEKILILKNTDNSSSEEAEKNEEMLQNKYNLFG